MLGDFNARIAEVPDYIINDDNTFVDVPVDYVTDSGNTMRNNSDHCRNAFGNKLVELCRMSEIRIINGRKFGDTMGKKTCFQWNGCSTVDYMLADVATLPRVQTFHVKNLIPHVSDHCPISAIINLEIPIEVVTKTEGVLSAPKKIRWDDTSKRIFATKLLSPQTKTKLNSLSELKICHTSSIEEAVEEREKVLNCDNLLEKNKLSAEVNEFED